MTATGIGASVRRKEDFSVHHRQGPATPTTSTGPARPTPTSSARPHAHADDQAHRRLGRAGDARRARRAHRRRPRRRQGRRPDLRLDDPFQGRLADEGGRASGAGAGQGALCRRPRRRRHRRDASAGARTRPRRSSVDYDVLPAVVDMAQAHEAGAPQVHDVAPDNRIYRLAPRRQGGDRRRLRQAPSTSPRSTSSTTGWSRTPMEPRAARRRLRRRAGRLHALHHEPEPACGAARAVGLHRHRARAQAARDRAGRRRRLRLQDLHLCRGDGLRLGGEEGRPAGEVDGRPHRGLPVRRAWPRPRHPRRAGDRRRAARSSACG